MNKLIVVIMGPGNDNFLSMCLKSVKDVDKVLYFTSDISQACEEDDIYFNGWDESDTQTNGKSRNVYLDHLKKNYPDDWCLVVDEDEVVEDSSKVKDFIKTASPGLYSPKMRHFIGDLGHEDATHEKHFVPNRLFKISEAKNYPLDSHPVLVGNNYQTTDCTTIWHLGHLPVEYMNYINKRYNQHINDSNIHSKDFLDKWRLSHLFGVYPKSQINALKIPKIILDNFDLEFDELYFNDRKNIKTNHYQDCIDWKNYFNPNQVILYGCAFGQRVKILNDMGVDAVGIELSQYAVDNALSKMVKQGDITKSSYNGKGLAVAYDLLEHIEYKDLNSTIDNLIMGADNILISVPVLGDPNLEADPTHKIKETKEWWIKQFTGKNLKQVEVPSHFLFREQLMIFKK